MATYYHFHSTRNNDDINIDVELERVQCNHITFNGQCLRNTVIGVGLCWQHLLSDKKLRILDTENMGKGLFAMDKRQNDNFIIFRPNDLIITYTGGYTLDNYEKEDIYGHGTTAPYAIFLTNNSNHDCASKRCIASLINHIPSVHANAEIRIYHGVANIRAKKIIRNGDEIMMSYGRSYQLNQNNVESCTNKKKNNC